MTSHSSGLLSLKYANVRPLFQLLAATILLSNAFAQTGNSLPDTPSIGRFFTGVFDDEKAILKSPAKVKVRDLSWILPLAGSTAFLISSDERNLNERIKTNAADRNRSSFISNAGVGSLALIPGVIYWWGWRHGDEYAMNSGLLTARAVADSLVVSEGIQWIARRERPTYGDGSGRFGEAGSSSSFPSLHAAAAWSLASVLARRYPGWLSQVGLYGIATAVSFSRVTAKEHFPSDVVVGSALGWLVGRYVSGIGRQDRIDNAEPSHATSQTTSRKESAFKVAGNEVSTPEGSPYVPMDSWIYDALDRLAAFGLIPSQTSGLRPWTRAECFRQTVEADEEVAVKRPEYGAGVATQVIALLSALHRELDETEIGRGQITLDSVYVSNGVITGPPLNDSYHFGQTWRNNFGHPNGRGWNSIDGFEARAESGRFFASVRGEYQRSPGQSAYSLPTRELIARLDNNPLQDAEAVGNTNRFRTIEAYGGVRVGDFELSIGKQSLYWGPTYDAPLSFSDNAEPTKNGKISMVHPIRLPGVLHYLGEIRGEFVTGKLGGQKYTWRPWFNAQKLTFKLTSNLELGFTRWSLMWGVGHPITADSFARNFVSFASTGTNFQLGDRADPGDRKGGFDFRYRIPGLRNWLTVYSDSYSEDDPSPLAAPRRAAINPGIYLTRVPGIPKLDLRVEAPSTIPMSGDHGGFFSYWNNQYHSANTNYGYLLGNPVGRDARAIEGWSTYWLSTRNKVQVGYRQLKTGSQFLPGGGTQSDASIKGSIQVSRRCFAELMFQYERYWIPALGGPRSNLSSSIRLSWEPELKLLH